MLNQNEGFIQNPVLRAKELYKNHRNIKGIGRNTEKDFFFFFNFHWYWTTEKCEDQEGFNQCKCSKKISGRKLRPFCSICYENDITTTSTFFLY